MRKTFSLLGLLFVGLMLLANPSTGLLATPDAEAPIAAAEPTTTTSGEPPTDDQASTTTTYAAETDDFEATTTTTTADVGGSYSVVGSVEDSRFGSFQVEVFFENEAIVAVEALQLPGDRKSASINNSAVPIYEAAVIDEQSADIDVVSGATVTWDNYTASLQSALDEVGL